MAPALKSCFERTIHSKVTIFNFGETIYLKSRAVRQAAKRVCHYFNDKIERI
jgi:hypothetical protein